MTPGCWLPPAGCINWLLAALAGCCLLAAACWRHYCSEWWLSYRPRASGESRLQQTGCCLLPPASCCLLRAAASQAELEALLQRATALLQAAGIM